MKRNGPRIRHFGREVSCAAADLGESVARSDCKLESGEFSRLSSPLVCLSSVAEEPFDRISQLAFGFGSPLALTQLSLLLEFLDLQVVQLLEELSLRPALEVAVIVNLQKEDILLELDEEQQNVGVLTGEMQMHDPMLIEQLVGRVVGLEAATIEASGYRMALLDRFLQIVEVTLALGAHLLGQSRENLVAILVGKEDALLLGLQPREAKSPGHLAWCQCSRARSCRSFV